MNDADVTEAVNNLEGLFHKYDERKAAAIVGWLRRAEFRKADVLRAADALVDKGAKHPPNAGELLEALRELDLIPTAAPGYGDPRLIAEHSCSIKDDAAVIARLRGITFADAVRGIRDEQQDWLAEGIASDYLDTHDRGWHRDRIEACAAILAGEGVSA
jgi:hypothetical protein